MTKSGLCAAVLLLVALIRPGISAEYIFLVTGDGIRHQEVFTGVDPMLLDPEEKKASGIQNLDEFRKQYWADTARERREKVMPFFWKELSRQGMIFGNRALNSHVVVSNTLNFSYPGYAEILNGGPVTNVTSNDPVFSPRETVLEFARKELELRPHHVAVFGSWRIFNWIVMQRTDALFCNAGYEAIPPEFANEKMNFWSGIQFEILSPWDSVRHDAVTLELGLEYIREHKPRIVYLALGETDDWAHDRRYDRMVQSLRYFDEALKRLWNLIQETEPYRGKSALIVTTDHGRGTTLDNWTSHGEKFPESMEAWLAVFGAGVPARGEMSDTKTWSLSNVAPTMLRLLGLDPAKFNPNSAPPISDVFDRSE